MSIQDMLPTWVVETLKEGVAIPAHPLALTSERKFDERHQQAVTRYYLDAGAGGIAIGVHTTQFEIRQPEYGLFQPVLQHAKATLDQYEANNPNQKAIRIAGICGGADQAVKEAAFARENGYHIGLLSMGALQNQSVDELIEHAKQVANEIAVMGFYLQPSCGGRVLNYEFWRRFCEIENVAAVKVAPFQRYHTLDVIRGLVDSGRQDEISLYTGNDDTILYDLLSTYRMHEDESKSPVRFVGGLLGHWAFWTKKAVKSLNEIKSFHQSKQPIPQELLLKSWQVTDVNQAAFDPVNHYHGCISGINEMLRRQGLLTTNLCLNPNETLSPGQLEEIERVHQAYPSLHDDEFVQNNLDRWLDG